MASNPLVSVCVPARNAAKYIEETLQSIVGQTYTNWELIITENCSTDDTRKVVEAFLAKQNDPRIQLHINDTSLDMAGNWNRAVSFAKGKYIKVVCADDTIEPHCLETELKILEQYPEVILVASARRVINAQSKPLFVRRSFSASGKHDGKKIVKRCLLAGTNIIGDPMVITFRASGLPQTGGFDSSIIYCTDMELWLRLLLHGDFYVIREPLGRYRVHGTSEGTSVKNKVVQDFLRVIDGMERAGGIRLAPWQRKLSALKSRYLSAARQALYRFVSRHH